MLADLRCGVRAVLVADLWSPRLLATLQDRPERSLGARSSRRRCADFSPTGYLEPGSRSAFAKLPGDGSRRCCSRRWFWRAWYAGLSERDGQSGVSGAIKLGLLMGFCAWGRVDAAFLMVGIGVAQLVWSFSARRYKETITELGIMASLAAVSIFPWLFYGKKIARLRSPSAELPRVLAATSAGTRRSCQPSLFEYVVGLLGVLQVRGQPSGSGLLCPGSARLGHSRRTPAAIRLLALSGSSCCVLRAGSRPLHPLHGLFFGAPPLLVALHGAALHSRHCL